jgi:hypothetical protein
MKKPSQKEEMKGDPRCDSADPPSSLLSFSPILHISYKLMKRSEQRQGQKYLRINLLRTPYMQLAL